MQTITAIMAILRDKPLSFGIPDFCCLSRFFCLVGHQSKILYQHWIEQCATYYYPAAKGHGRYILRVDRSLLWRISSNAGHMGLSCQQYPGIPSAFQQPARIFYQSFYRPL